MGAIYKILFLGEKGAGEVYPFLSEEKRVDNDFRMKNEDFFIITGANMAGKSTFLRTVALNIVLANNGLPVCAKSFSFSAIDSYI